MTATIQSAGRLARDRCEGADRGGGWARDRARRVRDTKKPRHRRGARRPAPSWIRLPVELDAEPPQPRRHDRRRLQVSAGGTPVDVLRRVRVAQVVAVDEAGKRAAGDLDAPL